MKNIVILISVILFLVTALLFQVTTKPKPIEVLSVKQESVHWLLLHRQSNQEFLFLGEPGNKSNSKLIKTFEVKTGILGERPTPLPRLLGRDYWLITEKLDSAENIETAPYFLTLNIPVSEGEPYGPSPYQECKDPKGEVIQCNWILPGAFGLHGIAGDKTKISKENPGSSGCIRHLDEDITFLYNLLDPEKEETRYYIEDV